MSSLAFLPDIMQLSSCIGGVAFAISGFLAGVRHRLDVMGVFIVTMLTANGGGALRDVLIGKTPRILTDTSGFYLVIAVITLAWLLRLHRHGALETSRWFVTCDAIGLAAFSMTGSIAALDAGLTLFGVMVLSFITASGGGIIRDLMLNRVPGILSSDFYGSVALLIAAALYGLEWAGARTEISMLAVLLAALVLRLIAQYKGWRLPHVRLDDTPPAG